MLVHWQDMHYKDNNSTCTLLTACVGCIRHMYDSNDKTNHVVYLIAMKTRCSERGLFTPSHTQMQEWKERAGKGKRERRKEGACTTSLIMEAHGTRATQTRTHAHVQSCLQYVGVKHGRGKGVGVSVLLKASKAAHYKL